MLITSYDHAKVSDYLIKESPKKVCLIFYHGVGDVVMFTEVFNKLKTLFPDIQIDIVLQRGVGQEVLFPDALLTTSPNEPIDGYDFTFQIHFHMCEHLNGLWTKAEFCCIEELGIDPTSAFPKFPDNIKSPLVGINYQATALPGTCNPSEEVAKKIWDEVVAAGMIPIEAFFQHTYYNPVNSQFAHVDRGVRNIPIGIDKLIQLLSCCYANISVSTANLHLSIALMPKRTLYLKKDYSIKCYTKEPISEIDVNNYEDGSVKKWLTTL